MSLTHHPLRKHTLSLKSSPSSAPGPTRMHGPCRQTRKASERGAGFGQASIIFSPDIGLRLARPPLPPPQPSLQPSSAYSSPRGRGRGRWGRRGIQNLPSQKTNINNTNLRGGRFPSRVGTRSLGPGAGPGEQVTPSATGGGRSLALCQEAPEVLTHWLRRPAAARRIPVWHGESRAPQPRLKRERGKKRTGQ